MNAYIYPSQQLVNTPLKMKKKKTIMNASPEMLPEIPFKPQEQTNSSKLIHHTPLPKVNHQKNKMSEGVLQKVSSDFFQMSAQQPANIQISAVQGMMGQNISDFSNSKVQLLPNSVYKLKQNRPSPYQQISQKEINRQNPVTFDKECQKVILKYNSKREISIDFTNPDKYLEQSLGPPTLKYQAQKSSNFLIQNNQVQFNLKTQLNSRKASIQKMKEIKFSEIPQGEGYKRPEGRQVTWDNKQRKVQYNSNKEIQINFPVSPNKLVPSTIINFEPKIRKKDEIILPPIKTKYLTEVSEMQVSEFQETNIFKAQPNNSDLDQQDNMLFNKIDSNDSHSSGSEFSDQSESEQSVVWDNEDLKIRGLDKKLEQFQFIDDIALMYKLRYEQFPNDRAFISDADIDKQIGLLSNGKYIKQRRYVGQNEDFSNNYNPQTDYYYLRFRKYFLTYHQRQKKLNQIKLALKSI